jgi:hypothetical protein
MHAHRPATSFFFPNIPNHFFVAIRQSGQVCAKFNRKKERICSMNTKIQKALEIYNEVSPEHQHLLANSDNDFVDLVKASLPPEPQITINRPSREITAAEQNAQNASLTFTMLFGDTCENICGGPTELETRLGLIKSDPTTALQKSLGIVPEKSKFELATENLLGEIRNSISEHARPMAEEIVSRATGHTFAKRASGNAARSERDIVDGVVYISEYAGNGQLLETRVEATA